MQKQQAQQRQQQAPLPQQQQQQQQQQAQQQAAAAPLMRQPHACAPGLLRQHAAAAWWQPGPPADRAYASAAAALAAATDDEPPRRRRRGTTESRAMLRRTTEARAAIEDVAVMSKSQLLRRNKPWLAEQCWQRGLAYEGLKHDLVERLLDWQGTDAGRTAAADAAEAARAAALVAASAAAAAGHGGAPVAPAAGVAGSTAAAALAGERSTGSTLARPAAGAVASAAAAAVRPASADGRLADGADASTVRQPPRAAAEAAAASLPQLLAQLQQQPDNAAVVALTRLAAEHHANGLVASAGQPQAVQQAQLAATLSAGSSPVSLAALARACFAREALDPLLAASLAEAVAGAAPSLGPLEVFGVLRLLAEHLPAARRAGGPAAAALEAGFAALGRSLIRCSAPLHPVQLAEAVVLLQQRGYSDALGLWLLSKAAAARVHEFDVATEGGHVVRMLEAVADLRVADGELCADVAAAVAAQRGAFSGAQLAAVAAALARMGWGGGAV